MSTLHPRPERLSHEGNLNRRRHDIPNGKLACDAKTLRVVNHSMIIAFCRGSRLAGIWSTHSYFDESTRHAASACAIAEASGACASPSLPDPGYGEQPIGIVHASCMGRGVILFALAHPTQALTNEWEAKLFMTERVYGAHAAWEQRMDRAALAQTRRLPGVASAHIGLDHVLGLDDRIDFSDVLGCEYVEADAQHMWGLILPAL